MDDDDGGSRADPPGAEAPPRPPLPTWARPDSWITAFASPTPAFVYAPLPPAGLLGHRAELWDLAHTCVGTVTVALDVASSSSGGGGGDDAGPPSAVRPARLRLTDARTGAPFAEAPLPPGLPVSAVVEAAADSARYFAVRVVDGSAPGPPRTAVLGLGWADRPPASELAAALAGLETDRRRAVRAAGGGGGDGGGGGGGGGRAGGDDGPPPPPGPDVLALRPGETVRVPLAAPPPPARPGARAKLARAAAAVAAMGRGGGSGLLPPPPPAERPHEGSDGDGGWGAFVG